VNFSTALQQIADRYGAAMLIHMGGIARKSSQQPRHLRKVLNVVLAVLGESQLQNGYSALHDSGLLRGAATE
jgi:hypothetical protein